ncbi:MAG: hypothetical protein JWR83_1930 [Aeromicrobium sp.]|nr:hypothetical protein [Aeromicrobium sp.]
MPFGKRGDVGGEPGVASGPEIGGGRVDHRPPAQISSQGGRAAVDLRRDVAHVRLPLEARDGCALLGEAATAACH